MPGAYWLLGTGTECQTLLLRPQLNDCQAEGSNCHGASELHLDRFDSFAYCARGFAGRSCESEAAGLANPRSRVSIGGDGKRSRLMAEVMDHFVRPNLDDSVLAASRQ